MKYGSYDCLLMNCSVTLQALQEDNLRWMLREGVNTKTALTAKENRDQG